MYTSIRLVHVDNNRKITEKDDPEFLFLFQRGVLLSMKESGYITQMQYRHAESLLKEQRKNRSYPAAAGDLA